MTDPAPIGFYAVEIQRPDGDGWATVHTERAATGTGAEDAVMNVLRYRWPANIYDRDKDFLRVRREGLAGTAGWRAVAAPAAHNRPGLTDGGTFTFADLFLADIRAKATQRRTARAAVTAARQALRDAQSADRLAGYDLDKARSEAATVGVPEPDVAKATRTRTKGATP